MPNDLCCVLSPAGRTAVGEGGVAVDFDAVYRDLVAPAVRDAGLDPFLLERTGGCLAKADRERLILCSFAVVDLTGGGAGAHFDLGVRIGALQGATVMLCARPDRG